MKIGCGVPKTLLDLCRNDGRVVEVSNEGRAVGGDSDYRNDYWIYLADGYEWEGCGSIHETTIQDCRDALSMITRNGTEL